MALDASTTTTAKSASRTSSRVDLNDSTKLCGSFCMKPTVSVRVAFVPCGKVKRRVVESSVAKSLS